MDPSPAPPKKKKRVRPKSKAKSTRIATWVNQQVAFQNDELIIQQIQNDFFAGSSSQNQDSNYFIEPSQYQDILFTRPGPIGYAETCTSSSPPLPDIPDSEIPDSEIPDCDLGPSQDPPNLTMAPGHPFANQLPPLHPAPGTAQALRGPPRNRSRSLTQNPPQRPIRSEKEVEAKKTLDRETKMLAVKYTDGGRYEITAGTAPPVHTNYDVLLPGEVEGYFRKSGYKSVLEPDGPANEMSYEDALAAMTKETGPLLTSLKNMPGRPVDVVLFDSKGASVAVFALVVTNDVTLSWLVSWIQMFIDRWAVKTGNSEVLVLNSIKIRHSVERSVERYPPLRGVPVDERQTSGNYYMKWECGDGTMNEAYWNVFRTLLQMGKHEERKPKPIFKSYTVGFPVDNPPANLRNALGIAPSQKFQTKGMFPPMYFSAEEHFAFAGQMEAYTALAKNNDTAFEARVINTEDGGKGKQVARAPETLPSVSLGYKGSEYYGVKNDGGRYDARATTTGQTSKTAPVLPPFDISHGVPEPGHKGKVHPLDEYVTITVGGETREVYRPYKEPVSMDPAKTWSYYQKMGGDPQMHNAFNFDHIPFDVEDFPKLKVVNDIAVLDMAGAKNENLSGLGAMVRVNEPAETSNITANSNITIIPPTSEEQRRHDPKYQEMLRIDRERHLSAKGFCESDDDEFYPDPNKPKKCVPAQGPAQTQNHGLQRQGPGIVSQSTRRGHRSHGKGSGAFAGGQYRAQHNAQMSESTHVPRFGPVKIVDSPESEMRKMAASFQTGMRPDAPSFDYSNSNLVKSANFSSNYSAPVNVNNTSFAGAIQSEGTTPGLNANAPAFHTRTVQQRPIPPGFGNQAPISNSPALSRIHNQALSETPRNAKPVGSFPSSLADLGTLNRGGENRGGENRKGNHINTEFIPNTNAPSTSYATTPLWVSSLVSDSGNASTQPQQQQQIQRPDRSRTFNLESRPPGPNRTYGMGPPRFSEQSYSGVQRPALSQAMASYSGNMQQNSTESTHGAHYGSVQQQAFGISTQTPSPAGTPFIDPSTYSKYPQVAGNKLDSDHRQNDAMQAIANVFAKPGFVDSQVASTTTASTAITPAVEPPPKCTPISFGCVIPKNKPVIPEIFANLPKTPVAAPWTWAKKKAPEAELNSGRTGQQPTGQSMVFGSSSGSETFGMSSLSLEPKKNIPIVFGGVITPDPGSPDKPKLAMDFKNISFDFQNQGNSGGKMANSKQSPTRAGKTGTSPKKR